MIRDYERYHGSALARIVHAIPGGAHVRLFFSQNNASYVLDEKLGLYIKHSSKRMSPWSFSFKHQHQKEIEEMHKSMGRVILLFVCGSDGIAALTYEEFRQVVKESPHEDKWIRAYRSRKELYEISGSDDALPFKIGKSAMLEKIAKNLNQ